MSRKAKIVVAIFIIILGVTFLGYTKLFSVAEQQYRETQKQIDALIDAQKQEEETEGDDLFANSETIRLLLIGLDARATQTAGNCDAIQMLEINREKGTITITALPRGTYAPLPLGGTYLPTDYYVSNSCRLGGIEYGLQQIQNILGMKYDHVAFIGFSEALGIFRLLDLPTTETLQWLRHRQSYQIGEPQRAHNHSTFIKTMITKFANPDNDNLCSTILFPAYHMVKTDLSFAQTKQLCLTINSMFLSEHPENISLTMKPWYAVMDIPYDETSLENSISTNINFIKDHLSTDDYAGQTEDEVQKLVMNELEQNINDPIFVASAYDRQFWLQIDNEEARLATQFLILTTYLNQIESSEEKQTIVADYVLDMELLGYYDWAQMGRDLLLNLTSEK